MHDHDTDFCDFRELTTLVMTWNAGAVKPTSLRQDERDANFFRELLQSAAEPPDIFVFGFQELVDLEDKKVTASKCLPCWITNDANSLTESLFRSKKKTESAEQEHMSHQYRNWRDHLIRCLQDFMPVTQSYGLVHTANMVGLFTCIFVKTELQQRIRNLNAAQVKLGMGGLHGNKVRPKCFQRKTERLTDSRRAP